MSKQHPRLTQTFAAHKDALAARAAAWGASNPQEMFNQLAAADPSAEPAYGHGKPLYTNWLALMAAKGHLKPADLPEIRLALQLFAANPEAGDLGRHKTPQALVAATLDAPRRALNEHLCSGENRALWQRLDGFPVAQAAQTDFALTQLLKTDPSGGRRLPHLLRWLNNKSQPLLPEDLPRVQANLEIYNNNRQHLMPASKRDLGQCTTASDLAGLVAPFKKDAVYTLDERLAFEATALANNDAREIANTSSFRLIHITSMKGAQKLGKGTSWCTSWGDGDGRQNQFETYKDDLLYLRSKRDGSIYQFHFRNWMLMDTRDESIKAYFLEFLQEHNGLQTALKPYMLPGIATGLSQARHNTGRGDGEPMTQLLEFCRKDPDYKAAVVPELAKIIPDALISSAENDYSLDETARLLKVCMSDQDYKAAAIPALPAAIWTALTRGSSRETMSGMTEVLEICATDQDCKAAALPALKAIPDALTEAAEQHRSGWIRAAAKLIKVCQSDQDYKAAAAPVLPKTILAAFCHTARWGVGGDMAIMFRACKGDPDHKALAMSAIPTALACHAGKGWACGVADVLSVCEGEPELEHIAKEWKRTRSPATPSGRLPPGACAVPT